MHGVSIDLTCKPPFNDIGRLIYNVNLNIIMANCLCVGPLGSGKTLLLKRLVSPDVDEGTSTVETVGSHIVHVPKMTPTGEPSKGRMEDKDFLEVREIGGQIAPLWPSYFSPDKLIMYVMDSSNLFQISIATVLLMELLCHEKLAGAKILIVLTKIDLTDRKKFNHLKFIMRLDTIIAQAGKRVSLIEASATEGTGIEDIRKWLVSNWPRPKLSNMGKMGRTR